MVSKTSNNLKHHIIYVGSKNLQQHQRGRYSFDWLMRSLLHFQIVRDWLLKLGYSKRSLILSIFVCLSVKLGETSSICETLPAAVHGSINSFKKHLHGIEKLFMKDRHVRWDVEYKSTLEEWNLFIICAIYISVLVETH